MIYGLVHPDTLEVRYIGKTCDALRRVKQHRRAARRPRFPVHCWWKSVVEQAGHEPCLVRLSEGDSAEEMRWIQELKADGARLLNMTEGGDGFRGTPEACAKIGRALRGRSLSPEHRAKARHSAEIGRSTVAWRVAIRSDARREAISLAQTGRVKSADECKRLADGQRGKTHPAFTRQKMSRAHLGQEKSVPHREALSLSAKRRGYGPSPACRAAARDANSGKRATPEARARMAEAQRARRAREHALKTAA